MQDTGVGDISALKGMQIKSLDISKMSVKDFSVIKTFPLVHLNVAGTKFMQLDMLKDLGSLTSLWLSDTEIGDLAPLSGLKLKALGIDNTKISDLSPLKGMELEELYCRKTKVKDFSVISGMPLKKIFVDDSVSKDKLKKLFPQLKFINRTWVEINPPGVPLKQPIHHEHIMEGRASAFAKTTADKSALPSMVNHGSADASPYQMNGR